MVLKRPIVAAAILMVAGCSAFSTTTTTIQSSQSARIPSSSSLHMSTTSEEKEVKKEKTVTELIGLQKNYDPKWKKKATLAESEGDLSAEDKGLVGAIPIVFQTGKADDPKRPPTLIKTSALPGQSLKLVASQAGQYIKYGCGKGECGTCESLCNGKYLRPCVDVVPTDLEVDSETGNYPDLVIQVKGTSAKVVSSGKFYSIKSIILGFWNNLLGMGGLVRDRRKAKKNWQDRMDNEDRIKQLTAEKKAKKKLSTKQ